MIGLLFSCGTPRGLGVSPDGKLKSVPKSPNCVSSQAEPDDRTHYMPAWDYADLNEAFRKIEQCIIDFGNTTVIKADSNYIHVVFVTGWMKWNDDVEFYFNENSKQIHFRSASRIGYSDHQVNRKRMKRLKEMFYNQ